MQSKIQHYVTGVTIAGLILFGALYLIDPGIPAGYLLLPAVCFFVFGLMASSMSYRSSSNTSGSIAYLPILTGLFLVPHWVGVLAATASALAAELSGRRAPIKIVFNTAAMLFASSVVVISYRFLGGASLLTLSEFAFVPYFVAVLLFFATNSLTISGIVGLQEDKNPLGLWLKRLRFTFVYDLLSIPIVFVFAYVYVHFGVPGAAIFMIPLLGARELYKKNWQLEKTNQELSL